MKEFKKFLFMIFAGLLGIMILLIVFCILIGAMMAIKEGINTDVKTQEIVNESVIVSDNEVKEEAIKEIEKVVEEEPKLEISENKFETQEVKSNYKDGVEELRQMLITYSDLLNNVKSDPASLKECGNTILNMEYYFEPATGSDDEKFLEEISIEYENVYNSVGTNMILYADGKITDVEFNSNLTDLIVTMQEIETKVNLR